MVQPLAKSRPAEEIAPVSAFLLETHSKMPDYMRLSIRILTLLFDTWSYPIKGKPFHRLPLYQRIDKVEAWENSRLEFRSEENTSELLLLMRIPYAYLCFK